MNNILNLIQKCLVFEKEPQKIGLSQFKEQEPVKKKEEISVKTKDIKLSDLMRRTAQ